MSLVRILNDSPDSLLSSTRQNCGMRGSSATYSVSLNLDNEFEGAHDSFPRTLRQRQLRVT